MSAPGQSSDSRGIGQGQLLDCGAEREVPAITAHLIVNLSSPDYEIPGEFLVTYTEPATVMDCIFKERHTQKKLKWNWRPNTAQPSSLSR